MKILILEGLHGNNKSKKCQWILKRTNLKVGNTVVLNCHDWKIIKVIGEGKIKENEFNQKMLGISCDLGADESCMVGWRVDIDGNINIDWIKCDKKEMKKIGKILIIKNIETGKCRRVKADEIDCFNPNIGDHINHYEIIVKIIKKEVRKVRPYFETKVVKVEKEKKCNHVGRAYPFSKTGDTIECVECGKKFILGQEEPKPKGNWVNGENLDKIKFPCFCSYTDSEGSLRKKGFLSASNGYYYIADITSQKKEQSDVGVYSNCYDLKTFIRENNIHILKGKIILFEEDESKEYDIDIEEE